jgi:hypothetical protein
MFKVKLDLFELQGGNIKVKPLDFPIKTMPE